MYLFDASPEHLQRVCSRIVHLCSTFWAAVCRNGVDPGLVAFVIGYIISRAT